ncbi:MAG: helix-turn-helix domain-containing protein [Hellea sp.]|nr:helix-turn-helix domain-containing protein [Hellea sp.]
MANMDPPARAANRVLVNHLISHFANTPEQRADLLKNTNISVSDLTRKNGKISSRDEYIFLANLTQEMGQDWVWRNPQIWKNQNFSPLDRALKNAPNCAAAMNVLTRLGHLFHSNLYFEQFEHDLPSGRMRTLRINMVPEGSDTEIGAKCVQHMTLIFIFFQLDQALNGTWKGAKIHAGPLQGVPLKIIQNIFSKAPETNTGFIGFTIPASNCEVLNQSADENIFKRAMVTIEKGASKSRQDDALKHQVRNYLAVVTQGRPNAIEVAKALGVSPRTLNRKLQTANTTFRELLEDSIKKRAHKLLAANTLSRADISDRLGYRDQASFSRALKRWRTNE